ncbi:MAG: hypothetical protein ZNDK_0219 [Candidatus Desulfovibrio kirbyi]|uniref:Lipoprotein n=1 Tax=Candidatus Desulfovibrio kirbyi TaxID=2696086 RepID=A0A6L2R4D4_9BACT|nr:MAG: hypothetical protein ZNDK_0219 [Candidatus Desulfovibrio kirbyi]
MLRLFTFALFLGLVGCSPLHQPTTEELYDAKQTQLEYPTNYQQAVKDYWRPRLVDPTAPLFEFYGEPRKGYARGGILSKRDIRFGWVVSYSINSKNRMGGYVGSKLRRALIKDNVVVTDWPDTTYSAMPGNEQNIEYLD